MPAEKKVFTEDESRVIRLAMLAAQSEWLEEAELSTSFAAEAISKLIAEAFEKEAAKYKTKEMNFNDHGSVISSAGTRSAWDDEHGVASPLPEAGEADGGPRHSAEERDH